MKNMKTNLFRNGPPKVTVVLPRKYFFTITLFLSGFLIYGLLIISKGLYADTIELLSGEMVHGRIIGEEKQTLKLLPENKDDKSKETKTFYLFRIKKIIKGNTYQDYMAKKEKCQTADDFYSLGESCKNNKLPEEALLMWAEAIKIDPNHEKSRKALGHRKENDRWLTQEEIKEAEGYVKFQNRWVKKDGLEKARQEEAKKKYQSAYPINIKIGVVTDVTEAWFETYRDRIKEYTKYLWIASEGLLYLNNVEISDCSSGEFTVLIPHPSDDDKSKSQAYRSCAGGVEMSAQCGAHIFVRQCGFVKLHITAHDGCILEKASGSVTKFCDECLTKIITLSPNVKHHPDFPEEPPEVKIKITNNKQK
ncbi:MAG: hypothetical protein HY811_06960 [Planctomycetes bacterium]|nr:hypothetical protein [Planctomycetota bacterium]